MENEIVRDLMSACEHAGMSIHHPHCKAHGEYSANPEKYCTCHVYKSQAALAKAKKAGKTLADFANSGKLFKRPMHANPHGFTAGSDSLKEIRTSTWGGQVNICSDFPRLTREDLTATDWEEVQ